MPLDFLNSKDAIERPSTFVFNAPKAEQFAEEMSDIRTIAKDSLKLAQLRYQESYNKGHLPVTFEPGDFVLVNIHSLELPESKGLGRKLAIRYDGPFEVLSKVSPVAYHIRLPHSYKIHPVLSIAHLKPYQSDEDPRRSNMKRMREDVEEFEVEEIVAEKREKHRNGYRLLYQCKWKNYGITDEWVTARDLRNAPEVLTVWKNKRTLESLQKPSR
jgi:hypothetical protein